MTTINELTAIYKNTFKTQLIEQLNNEIETTGNVLNPHLSPKYANVIIKEAFINKLLILLEGEKADKANAALFRSLRAQGKTDAQISKSGGFRNSQGKGTLGSNLTPKEFKRMKMGPQNPRAAAAAGSASTSPAASTPAAPAAPASLAVQGTVLSGAEASSRSTIDVSKSTANDMRLRDNQDYQRRNTTTGQMKTNTDSTGNARNVTTGDLHPSNINYEQDRATRAAAVPSPKKQTGLATVASTPQGGSISAAPLATVPNKFGMIVTPSNLSKVVTPVVTTPIVTPKPVVTTPVTPPVVTTVTTPPVVTTTTPKPTATPVAKRGSIRSNLAHGAVGALIGVGAAMLIGKLGKTITGVPFPGNPDNEKATQEPKESPTTLTNVIGYKNTGNVSATNIVQGNNNKVRQQYMGDVNNTNPSGNPNFGSVGTMTIKSRQQIINGVSKQFDHSRSSSNTQ